MTGTAVQDSEGTARAGWRSATRRRRVVVLLIILAVAVGWSAWRVMHRHDPRFVGRWLFTRGAEPTAEELHWTEDPSRAGDRIEWTINSDGTGQQQSVQRIAGRSWTGVATFTWSTDGECIALKWGQPRQGWAAFKETLNEMRRALRREPPGRLPDVYAYTVAEETGGGVRQFVLQFENAAHVRTEDRYCLTRIKTE